MSALRLHLDQDVRAELTVRGLPAAADGGGLAHTSTRKALASADQELATLRKRTANKQAATAAIQAEIEAIVVRRGLPPVARPFAHTRHIFLSHKESALLVEVARVRK